VPPKRNGNGASRSELPYLALHPMGFSVPRQLLVARWSLTPPFHPYLAHSPVSGSANLRRYVLCGTFRQNALRRFARVYLPSAERETWSAEIQFRVPRSEFRVGKLRGIALCGVRTFLSRLAPAAILHLSKIDANLRRPTTGARCLRHRDHANQEGT
jgi:hypothetical protein